MAEPTVQVPVSLIDQAANLLAYGGTRDLDLAGSFRALLSQPTPTAEPDEWIDGYGFPPPHLRGKALPTTGVSIAPHPAPRPDMTRLVSRLKHYVPTALADQIASDVADSLWLALHDIEVENAARIDPSTIRDVQPPKET